MCTGCVQLDWGATFWIVQISAVPFFTVWSTRFGSKVLPLIWKFKPWGSLFLRTNFQVCVLAIGILLISGYVVKVAGTWLLSVSSPTTSKRIVTCSIDTPGGSGEGEG